jgi:hypothetical protein
MLSQRDLAMIAAASRQAGRGGHDGRERPRRGCLPGCTLPLILFILCGLPFDLLVVLKFLGIAK